ncbi:MAG: hypothetical protein MJZ82_01080 [Paludibacteraceae bacterium]|nr:hypothetical protein [Paludibacteraceae bacterium]
MMNEVSFTNSAVASFVSGKEINLLEDTEIPIGAEVKFEVTTEPCND